jgi:two-component system response regulator FixJ
MESQPIVYIVDDDPSIRNLVEALVRGAGLDVKCFANADEFAGFTLTDRPSCILLDLEMPGRSGLEMLDHRFPGALPCPVIIMTAHASVPLAVKSLKRGVVDFLEKPFEHQALLRLVQAAIASDRTRRANSGTMEELRKRLATLSPRERELLGAVIDGKSTKMIADELQISARTVDHHRANLMEKMQAANVADLVRMALKADFNPKASGTRHPS